MMAKILKPNHYLEIGTGYGDTFNLVCKYAEFLTGIDRVKRSKVNSRFNVMLYKGDSDSFFKTNKSRYDMIFIDGDHRFDQVKKDIVNALSVLNYDGVIFVHDTFPKGEIYKIDDKCSDSWKVPAWIRSNPFVDVMDVKKHPGLTIIKHKEARK